MWLIIPVSTAHAERSFSCMARIKDDERERLGQTMLDDLMMISMNGPPLLEFNYQAAVFQWYTAAPRREKLTQHVLDEWNDKKPRLDV